MANSTVGGHNPGGPREHSQLTLQAGASLPERACGDATKHTQNGSVTKVLPGLAVLKQKFEHPLNSMY